MVLIKRLKNFIKEYKLNRKTDRALSRKSKGESVLSEEAQRWNRFIYEVCDRDINTLSEIQKNAVLCFGYDAEMNSGGHSGYFECYPDTVPQELVDAIIAVSYKAIADNYLKALNEGEKDGWIETDGAYYGFSPSLGDCLEEYVENHKDVIFI